MTITPERIAELRALCNAALLGPWKTVDNCLVFNTQETNCVAETWAPEDAEFIATSRTAMPGLLDEIERLRAELDGVRRAARTISARNGKLIAHAGEVYAREQNLDANMEGVQVANALLTEEVDRLREMVASRDNLTRSQEAEIERLRAGIRALIEGSPHRRGVDGDGTCVHSVPYEVECAACIAEYLEKLLEPTK